MQDRTHFLKLASVSLLVVELKPPSSLYSESWFLCAGTEPGPPGLPGLPAAPAVASASKCVSAPAATRPRATADECAWARTARRGRTPHTAAQQARVLVRCSFTAILTYNPTGLGQSGRHHAEVFLSNLTINEKETEHKSRSEGPRSQPSSKPLVHRHLHNPPPSHDALLPRSFLTKTHQKGGTKILWLTLEGLFLQQLSVCFFLCATSYRWVRGGGSSEGRRRVRGCEEC